MSSGEMDPSDDGSEYCEKCDNPTDRCGCGFEVSQTELRTSGSGRGTEIRMFCSTKGGELDSPLHDVDLHRGIYSVSSD